MEQGFTLFISCYSILYSKNYRYYPYRYLFVSFDKESKAKRSIAVNTERFVNTHIDTIDLLTRNNEHVIDAVRQFDAIVVGSDQVWRATMSDIPTYFYLLQRP